MPIYEYQCSACGHRLEKFQKISDDPLTLCPACNTDNLQKLVSAASFQLKGSGWYQTDFKDSKPKAADNKKPTKDSPSKPSSDNKAAEKKSSGTKPATDSGG